MKVTVGGDGTFTFDTSYSPDFNLSNGQLSVSGPLAPGVYSVAETGIPMGWELTSAVCDDGSAPASIGLAASETVTCTFTNTKRGNIIVRKVTVGGDDTFTFDPSYGPSFNLSNGQQNDSGPLVPGTYSVAETGIPMGWELTSAACDDGSSPASIELAPGEIVTCTFTNTLAPEPTPGPPAGGMAQLPDMARTSTGETNSSALLYAILTGVSFAALLSFAATALYAKRRRLS